MSKINIALIENSSKQNLFPGDYSGTIYYYIYNFFKDYKGGTSIRNFMYDLNFWLVGVFRFFIAIYRCFLKFKKDFMFLFKKEYFPIFYKYSVHEDAKKYITPEEYNSSFINKTLFIKPFGSFYIKCKERAVIYKEIIDWNDELHVAFFVPMNKKISSGYYTSWMYNIFLPYKIAHLFYQSLCAHIGKAIRISYEYDRYKREERRSPTYFGKIGTIDYTYSYPYGRPETTPDRTPVFFSEVEHYVGFFLYDIWNKHRKYTRKINIFKANCFYFFYEICSISLKYLSLIVYIIPLFPILLKVFYFIRNEWRLNAGAYYLDEYDTSDRSKRWRYAEVRSVSGFASFIRRILEFIGRIIRNNSEIFYFIINIFIIIIKKSYEYIKFLIKFIIKKSFKFFLFLCKLILLKPLIFFGNLYSIKKFRYLIGRVLSANIQGGTIFNEFIRAIRIVEYDLWTYPKKDIAFMNACRFDPIYNPNRWIDDVSYEISREIGWQTDYFISFVFDANFLEDMLYHDEDATWWDLMDDGDEHEEEPYALIYRYWDTELQWPNYEADGLRDFIDLFYSEHIDGITEYFADVNREARQHRARVLPYSDAYVNYYRAWLKYMRNYTYLHYTMLVEQDRINWLILCFLFLCCTAMWDPLFNERVFDLHWYSMMSDVFGYNLTYDNVLSFKLFEVLVPEKIRDLITSFDVLTERTWYAKYFFALNKYRQHLIHEMYTTKVAPGVVFADTIYGFVFVKVLAALPLPMVSFKSYGTMNLWDNFYISRENFSGFKQALPYMFDSSGRYVIVYDEFRHFDWTDFPRWNNRPTFFDGIQGYMRDYMPRNVFYDFFSGCDREQAFSTVNTWNRRLSAKSDAIKFVMPRLSETIANKDPAFDYILRKSNELFFSLRKDLRLQYYLSNMFSRKNAYNDEYNVLLTSRDQVLEPIMQNYTNINKYLRSFYWKPKNILYDILVKYDRTGIGIYLLGFDKYSIFQNPYKGKCVESFMTHPYAYDAGRMKNWYSDYSPYYNRDSIDSICRYRQTYYKDMRLIDPILNKKYFHYPLKNVGTPFIDLNKKLFMFSPYLDQYFYNQIKSTPIYISPFGEIYLHPIAYHINLDNLRVGKHNYDFIRYDLSSSYAYNKAYKAYLSSIFNHKYLRMRDLDYEYDINSICSDAIKKEFKLKLKQHLINFRDLKNNKIHQFAQNLDSIYEPISHRFFGNEVQQLNTGLARSADEIRALCSGRGEDILDDYLQKSRDFTDFFDAVLRYCKDCVYLTLNYYNIPAKLPLTFTFSFSLSDFEFRGQEIAEQLMSYLIRREAGVEDALLKTPENPEEVLEEMYDEEFNNILDFYEDYLHPLSKYYKRKETVNYLYKNYPNFVENLFPYSNKWHKTKEIGSRNAFLLSDFLRFKERVAYWDVDFVRTPRNKLKNYYNLLLLNYRDVDNLNTVASFIEDKKFDVVVKHLGRSGKNYLTFKRGLEYFINEPMTVNNLFEKMLENDAVLSSSKNFWDHFSHGDELNNFGQNRYIKEFGIESYNQFFDFKNLESMYLNDLSAGQRYRALKKNYYN